MEGSRKEDRSGVGRRERIIGKDRSALKPSPQRRDERRTNVNCFSSSTICSRSLAAPLFLLAPEPTTVHSFSLPLLTAGSLLLLLALVVMPGAIDARASPASVGAWAMRSLRPEDGLARACWAALTLRSIVVELGWVQGAHQLVRATTSWGWGERKVHLQPLFFSASLPAPLLLSMDSLGVWRSDTRQRRRFILQRRRRPTLSPTPSPRSLQTARPPSSQPASSPSKTHPYPSL